MFNKRYETNTQYRARVGCLNCDNVQDILIDKGKLVEVFCQEKKVKCGFCQCTDSLQPYFQYQSMKKMLSNLGGGMFKPPEEAGEGKHSHYG